MGGLSEQGDIEYGNGGRVDTEENRKWVEIRRILGELKNWQKQSNFCV